MTAGYIEAATSVEEPPRTFENYTAWSGLGRFEEPLEFSERDRVELLNATQDGAIPCLDSYRYRLRAVETWDDHEPRDVLEILPVPGEDLFATIIYLPQLTLAPVGDRGEVKYRITKDIGTEWLILDVLETCLAKTKEEIAVWKARKLELQAELLAQAPDRDSAQPARIKQVWHRTDAGRPREGWPGGRGGPWQRGR